MKYLTVIRGLGTLLIIAAFSACVKNLDTPLIKSYPINLTSFGTLSEALAAGKSTLFRQALLRTGTDTILKSTASFFTVLVPTDAAMQQAGLTAETIKTFPHDSLKKLVLYHIIYGSLTDTAMQLAAFNIKAPTMLAIPAHPGRYGDVPFKAGIQLPIFIKSYNGQGLYANDYKVASPVPPLIAGNGYAYIVDKVIIPTFHLNIMDILRSQPDLSMYLEALRIVDKLNRDIGNIGNREYEDTLIFSRMGFLPANESLYGWEPSNCLTVFAPTNDAFIAAGFKTIDDIRSYAAIHPNTNSTRQSPMDSILRRHVVFNFLNTNNSRQLLLYSDILFNTGFVANSGMDTYFKSQYQGYNGGNYMKLDPLKYSAANGIPYIQWSPDATKPLVPVPADNPAAQFPNHFFGSNGVVYKVHKLFH